LLYLILDIFELDGSFILACISLAEGKAFPFLLVWSAAGKRSISAVNDPDTSNGFHIDFYQINGSYNIIRELKSTGVLALEGLEFLRRQDFSNRGPNI
jgi:hypothetical protein